MSGKFWKYTFFIAFVLTAGRALAQQASAVGESDVIALTLRRNLGIQASAYNPQIAATEITKAKSQFDTHLSGQAAFNLDRSDKTSIIFGTDNRTVLYEARAEKKLPAGVQGAISLSNQRDSTNSAFATDPIFWETILRTEVSAPMLRNRFGKSDRALVSLSQAKQKVAAEQAYIVVQNQVAESLTQYWNWVATQYYFEVSRRFLKAARDFSDSTFRKKALGLAEETDTLAAQSQVLEREAEVSRASNLVKTTEKRLRYLLDEALEGSWRSKDPLRGSPPKFSKADLLRQALDSRPEYLSLRREVAAKDIQIALAKDQTWPSLDLFTSLELNSVDPNYGRALGETWSAQHPNWLVGAQFKIDLENRFAKGELDRSRLEKAQVLVQLKETENLIALEIDENWRQLLLQQKERDRYSQAARFQNQKMNLEFEKYTSGRSDSDTIVRFQNDALAAERQRLEAELRYRLAWVQLRKSVGAFVPNGKESALETR
ncbi:MAG TPA: hypothetical protein DF383_01725 [Deltaproteobacteria bacterium]|nr:hypothetical protein [Deltaproteobacteria bacterium]